MSMNKPFPASLVRIAVLHALALLGALHAGQASAQAAIERNLPPAPPTNNAPVPAPDVVAASDDATPLGADLRAIVLLDQDDVVVAAGATREAVSVERLPHLDRASVKAALAQYIGRPISRQLISEVQAQIARISRSVGRPFVSMSTPPQEITSGVLQVRVTEFKAADVQVSGATSPEQARWVRERIRLSSGQPIDSTSLAQDLDWLNRNPFADAAAEFAPASAAGTTDLDVKVDARRPYRVYAGYATTGSEATGIDRFFVGAMFGLPVIPGSYFSYQRTGSSDVWHSLDSVRGRGDARYLSNGLRAYVPLAPRQNLEFTYSDVETNQSVSFFDIRQRTSEATIGYRTALSNLGLSSGAGDLLLGLERKKQHREVGFGPIPIVDVSASVAQALVGWSKGYQGNGQQGQAAVNLHVSSSGLGGSSGEELALMSNGRITSSSYAYLTTDLEGAMRLPGNLALSSQLSMQFASGGLPLAAQIGLGGDTLVRGYSSEDGSFDAGLVWRNELQLAPFSLLSEGMSDRLTPFVFFDAGRGFDRVTKTSA
ncbi:MAG: ShlB/FhaC/HecB family hemolysin secretion/activation protein, partial [Comamonadaceae bacterium]